jgi:cell division protein FtsI (penicillin-binding protein 3)
MGDQAQTQWRQVIRRRVAIAAVVFAAWAAVIEGRLIQFQVFERADLQSLADRQRMRTIDQPAKRGAIVDRNGEVLAYSVDEQAIWADPSEIEDPAGTAAKLCGAIAGCSRADLAALREKLSNARGAYVRRANQITPEDARRVEALGLPGICFLSESRRYYPKGVAAHVLGYVGVDSVGRGGIEAAYNKSLAGRNGQVLVQVDNQKLRRPFARVSEPSTPGATLQLTIDEFLQHVAERELHAGVRENRATGGSVVMMNPFTGEILALANEPSFNPDNYQASSEQDRRNRAVQDIYEPGSTFKIVTASAAIEEHVVKPDDLIDVSAGQIRIGNRVVHDTHRYDALSFTDVLVRSSNVGAIKIGFMLGAERLGAFVRRFGFATRLSPDFPGENPGIVWDPANWNDSAMASVSMGYQVGVTPLQMATAASAVANGGELLQPRVVKAIVDAQGVRHEVRPRVLGRAIEKTTAQELTTIMEQVVERGTATAAQVDGYTVAGKTGTAAKLENGHYSDSDYNASFVGFVPSRKPAVTILVLIDSPRDHGYYGGTVSGPVFKRIAEETLRYLGIGPTLNAQPPLLVASRVPAPDSAPVRAAVTRPGMLVRPASSVASLVPDVVGLSARDAIRVLAQTGLNASVRGLGVVVQQYPPAGSAFEPGETCSLALARVPSTTGFPKPDQHQ